MKGRKPAQVVSGSHVLVDVPKAPVWLSAPAKAEWKRVAAILVERGVLTEADLGILASCCDAFGTIIECRRTIQREGLTLVAPNGTMKRHPAVAILNATQAQHRQLCAELGLTPYSRSRTALQGGAPDDGEDLSPLDF